MTKDEARALAQKVWTEEYPDLPSIVDRVAALLMREVEKARAEAEEALRGFSIDDE
jgi:hypothetical protein